MTAFFAFFAARRWLVEVIGLGLLLAGIAWWHHATFEKGIDRQRQEDRVEIDRLTRAADLETARLKGIADAAEKTRDEEHNELVAFRQSDPLHGGLCKPPADTGGRRVSQTPGAHAEHADAGTAARTVQPVPARNPEPSGQRDPDVRHLLDVLAGRADEVSSTLREFQTRQQ
jgi:hypothetical protein